jgi:hypothetical protein
MLEIFCPGADGIQEVGGLILFISAEGSEEYWFSGLFQLLR